MEMQFADFVSPGFNPIKLISEATLQMARKVGCGGAYAFCGGGTQAGPSIHKLTKLGLPKHLVF